MNFCCSNVTQAIINNDVETFNELLNKRKRIDIPDNLGYTSLHIAAKQGASISPVIINLLLNHPDLEINAKSFEGHTSLYVACDKKNSNVEIIKKILDHGADPNIGDLEQVSPLHLACKYGNIDLVDLLIKYHANIDSEDFNLYTPLHYSIEYNFKEITEYLLKANANANITNLHGLNPLMFAIENSCEYADILLPYTNDLNAKTTDNYDAILLAIKRDNFHMVQSLIDCGVHLNFSEYSPDAFSEAIKVNNYEIFKIVWEKKDPHKLQKYDTFLRKILIQCNSFNDFRYLQLVINDPQLDCNFRGKKGIFAFIFYRGTNLNLQYTEQYFNGTKEIYYQLFNCLLNQGVLLSFSDVESFIFYFYTCPYRIDLLKLLLGRTKPNITELLVLYAFEYDLKMGALLLQYCLDVFPNNLFKAFKTLSPLQVEIWEILVYFLKYFTPSKKCKEIILEKLQCDAQLNNLNDNLHKLLQNNVKSLTELSRDVIRNHFRKTCKVSSEFLEKVDQLEVPDIVKDYIKYKLPVRRI